MTDSNVNEPFKSQIPQWAKEKAEHLVENYGFDEAFLVGAIAAALDVEREAGRKMERDYQYETRDIET